MNQEKSGKSLHLHFTKVLELSDEANEIITSTLIPRVDVFFDKLKRLLKNSKEKDKSIQLLIDNYEAIRTELIRVVPDEK